MGQEGARELWRIAAAWEALRPLTLRGPCRNCHRMRAALAELQEDLARRRPDAERDRLLAALQSVRRPPDLHDPLGCEPCSTRAILAEHLGHRAACASPAAARRSDELEVCHADDPDDHHGEHRPGEG